MKQINYGRIKIHLRSSGAHFRKDFGEFNMENINFINGRVKHTFFVLYIFMQLFMKFIFSTLNFPKSMLILTVFCVLISVHSGFR